jgi:Transposase DDE domain
MLVAYRLAEQSLPKYSHRFSRKDFTLPQLFACLAVREHQNKSYRGVEALLRDAQHWCKDIGMRRVPDHNTLCRAFHAIVGEKNAARMLDLLARWFEQAGLLGRVLGIDSSLYDTHHRSRHYEQRRRHYSTSDKRRADVRRSRSAKRTPKLAIAADTRCHAVLAARARTGMGSDCRDFGPVLRDARGRNRRLRLVVADAGYDSHANHRLAREQLGVRSLIKTGMGRPSAKPPSSPYRRLMSRTLRGSQKGRPYAQRAQAETVNSMLKRNLGDSLRARSAAARRNEQMLRVITHNVMLLRRRLRGSRQNRTQLVSASPASRPPE